MKSANFLYKELRTLAEKFPNVNIRYGYDSIIETHIVELLPLEEYNNNINLDNSWIPLSIKFMETFSNEDIAFISSDSSLSIDKVLFEFNAYCHSEDEIISELYGALIDNEIHYSFSTKIASGELMSDIKSSYSIGTFLESPSQKRVEDTNLDSSYLAAA